MSKTPTQAGGRKKLRKVKPRVKIVSKMKTEKKIVLLNGRRTKPELGIKRGKFLGFCRHCNTSVMDEDQLCVKKGEMITQMLNSYLCYHCGKRWPREMLEQPIRLIGKWFLVTESKKAIFRVVARSHEEAVDYVRNREFHTQHVISTKRYRAVKTKKVEDIFVKKGGVV